MGEEHDPTNMGQAFNIVEQWPLRKPLKEGEKEHIPTGIIYKEDRPTFEESFPQIARTPLVHQSLEGIDINPLLEELK